MELPEQTIARVCRERYNGNLAAVLIFGSYFTGQYLPGESDIDLIVLFKKPLKNSEREREFLFERLKNLKLSIHHFRTLEDYKKKIYAESSWSSWIVVQRGSMVAYSTPEFLDFKKYIAAHKLDSEKLIKFIKEKDAFDLKTDLTSKSDFAAVKMLYAHIRRKLQILNFYKNNILEFDFSKCLSAIAVENKELLRKLSVTYDKRDTMSRKEIAMLVKISKSFTELVAKTLAARNQKV